MTAETARLHVPQRPASPLAVALPPWRPEIERWEETEDRILRAFDDALAEHREATRRRLLDEGLDLVPDLRAEHHFTWLAQRQHLGWRPSRIARRAGVTATAVSAACRNLARLLDLALRPVKPGPDEL